MTLFFYILLGAIVLLLYLIYSTLKSAILKNSISFDIRYPLYKKEQIESQENEIHKAAQKYHEISEEVEDDRNKLFIKCEGDPKGERFKVNEKLKQLIRELIDAELQLAAEQKKHRLMIESNFAIQNGQKIEEVYEKNKKILWNSFLPFDERDKRYKDWEKDRLCHCAKCSEIEKTEKEEIKKLQEEADKRLKSK